MPQRPAKSNARSSSSRTPERNVGTGRSSGRHRAIARIIELIRTNENIVALTGAGISTNAGIPDFRSPNSGLWDTVDSMFSFTARGFQVDPQPLYEVGKRLLPIILKARPTHAHRLLTMLEKEKRLDGVITQNIDALHQTAETHHIIELHGNLRGGYCISCTRNYDIETILEKVVEDGELPPSCEKCGGVIKPNIVLFGDPIPRKTLIAARRLVKNADLMLVLGSSLTVSPAAELPRTAIKNGASLVIINLQPTPHDDIADVVVHHDLDEVAEQLLEWLEMDKRGDEEAGQRL